MEDGGVIPFGVGHVIYLAPLLARFPPPTLSSPLGPPHQPLQANLAVTEAWLSMAS